MTRCEAIRHKLEALDAAAFQARQEGRTDMAELWAAKADELADALWNLTIEEAEEEATV